MFHLTLNINYNDYSNNQENKVHNSFLGGFCNVNIQTLY